MKKVFTLLIALLLAMASTWAQTEVVDALGASKGWYSDDTRDATGENLVGTMLTHYGKPGQTPTSADDATIAQQISFVTGPGGVGALKMDKKSTAGGYSKCTVSKINESGFASADSWLSNFKLDYSYNTASTAEYTVPKITIRSSNWSASQAGFTATRSGELAWDIILVDWRGSGSGWQ